IDGDNLRNRPRPAAAVAFFSNGGQRVAGLYAIGTQTRRTALARLVFRLRDAAAFALLFVVRPGIAFFLLLGFAALRILVVQWRRVFGTRVVRSFADGRIVIVIRHGQLVLRS